nr:hypothetical protein [Streptomyces taklimakanensis]
MTAAVAGGLLCGLWFVPSANATGEDAHTRSAASRTQDAVPAQSGTTTPGTFGDGAELADTGSFDTTPYLAGGLGFLGAGAALLAHARIRSGREGLTPAAR